MDKKVIYSLALVAVLLVAVYVFLPKGGEAPIDVVPASSTTLLGSDVISEAKALLFSSLDAYGTGAAAISYASVAGIKAYYKDDAENLLSLVSIETEVDGAKKSMHTVFSSNVSGGYITSEEYLLEKTFYRRFNDAADWNVTEYEGDAWSAGSADAQKTQLDAMEIISAYDETIDGIECRTVDLRLTDARLISEFKGNFIGVLPRNLASGKDYEISEMLFKRSIGKENLLAVRFSSSAVLIGEDEREIVVEETTVYKDYGKEFSIAAPV